LKSVMWNVAGFCGSIHAGRYPKVAFLVKIHVWAVHCCWNEALFSCIFLGAFSFSSYFLAVISGQQLFAEFTSQTNSTC